MNSKVKSEQIRDRIQKTIDKEGRDNFRERAKVSPNTLAAIASGEFPWERDGYKPEEESRQLRAWVRSISKVAIAAKENPTECFEAFGIPNTVPVQQAIRSESGRKAISAHSAEVAYTPIPRINFSDSKHFQGSNGVGRTYPVRVGLLIYPPFSELGDKNCFFYELADRLLGNIAPQLRIFHQTDNDNDVWDSEIDHFMEDLVSDFPSYNLVFGLFDTLTRRHYGVDFVSIPGWRIRLSAVYLSDRQDDKSKAHLNWLDWSTISQRNGEGKCWAHVINEEVGHLYIEGPCRYDNDHRSITHTDVKDIDILANELLEKTSGAQRSKLTAIFVADEETCRKVVNILNHGSKPTKRGSTAFEVKGAQNLAPTYPLAIAFKHHPDFSRDRELITNALFALFDYDNSVMAKFYADVTIRGLMLEDSSQKYSDFRKRSTWSPEFFRLGKSSATLSFWKCYGNEVARRIQMLRTSMPCPIGHSEQDLKAFVKEFILPDEKDVSPIVRDRWKAEVVDQIWSSNDE